VEKIMIVNGEAYDEEKVRKAAEQHFARLRGLGWNFSEIADFGLAMRESAHSAQDAWDECLRDREHRAARVRALDAIKTERRNPAA
jgi:hypothetical protein